MSLKNTVHAFKSGEIADALVEVGKREMAGGSGSRAPTGREVRIAKTPAAGIPAATLNAGEMELESAVCEIKQTGVALTTPVTKSTNLVDGVTPAKIEVWNITDSTITGDTFIMAVRHGGAWIAATGGGGGTGRTVYQLQATTGVSAASGLTTGSGTAEVLELQMPSGVYQGFGALETVRNPWEETIATGSMLTCHLENGVYVIIQASCPSE
jgi:hypothetical protein